MKRLLTALLLLSAGLFTTHTKVALAQETSQCPSLESAVLPPDQRAQLISQVNEQLNSQGIAGHTQFVVSIGSYGVANWWNPMSSDSIMKVAVVALQMEAGEVQATATELYAGDTASQLGAMGYPPDVAECLLQLLASSY
jgi:hypothetical protein